MDADRQECPFSDARTVAVLVFDRVRRVTVSLNDTRATIRRRGTTRSAWSESTSHVSVRDLLQHFDHLVREPFGQHVERALALEHPIATVEPEQHAFRVINLAEQV